MKSTTEDIFGMPIVLVLYFIGICLYGFCTHNPLPPEIAAEPDRVFPYFAAKYLPKGACGLLMAGVLAAGMSTISAVLHSLTSLFMVDVWEKLHPEAEKGSSYVHISRIATMVWGILAVLLAFYVMLLGNSIIEVSGIVNSFFSAPLGGVFILGMFTKRANTQGTLIGIVAGGHISDLLGLNKYKDFPLICWFGVFALLATCFVGYVSSLLFQSSKKQEKGLKA